MRPEWINYTVLNFFRTATVVHLVCKLTIFTLTQWGQGTEPWRLPLYVKIIHHTMSNRQKDVSVSSLWEKHSRLEWPFTLDVDLTYTFSIDIWIAVSETNTFKNHLTTYDGTDAVKGKFAVKTFFDINDGVPARVSRGGDVEVKVEDVAVAVLYSKLVEGFYGQNGILIERESIISWNIIVTKVWKQHMRL